MIETKTDHKVYNLLSPKIRNAVESVLQEKLPDFLQSTLEPYAIRVNTLKATVEQVVERLQRWGIGYTRHPFNDTGLILTEQNNRYTQTLDYYTGKIHGQGISSQIPVLALDPRPGESVLDMAASPGSKSTQIAAMMENRGRLLLNDPSVRRQQALLTNISRAGIINDLYLQMPGQRMGRLFHESFDKVLLDAPCSALSKLPAQVLRSHRSWTDEALQTLHNTQSQLLVSAVKAVKPGGTIIYSTCTLTAEENEMMLDRLLKEYPVELVDIEWLYGPTVHKGLESYQGQTLSSDLLKTRRILPFPKPMEAFFVAKMVKTDEFPLKGYLRKCPVMELRQMDDPDIRQVIDYITDWWGIGPDFFKSFNYHLTSKRLWLCAPGWDTVPTDMYVKAGLALAVRKTNQWKLTANGAQFLGNRITRNIIQLEETQLVELFKQGRLTIGEHRNGYFALKFGNEIIGSVSCMHGVLKTSLPHHFDLLL